MKSNKIDFVKIRIKPEEKAKLLALAKAHGLNLSEYMRRAGLAQEIKNRTDIEKVLLLAKLNADQARLGNLLKLAIDHENYLETERLIADIRQTQKKIKDAVNRV